MGRPRKLRPEGFSVTASPDQKGDISTTLTPDNAPKTVALFTKNGINPYLGKDTLEPDVPQYFVNKRKLIQVMKVKRGIDENGNPVYTIKRRLARTIFEHKKEGKRLIELLVKNKIPGVTPI